VPGVPGALPRGEPPQAVPAEGTAGRKSGEAPRKEEMESEHRPVLLVMWPSVPGFMPHSPWWGGYEKPCLRHLTCACGAPATMRATGVYECNMGHLISATAFSLN